MRLHSLIAALLLTVSAAAQQWQVPIATKKLANGLTVVVSEDHSAPTFGLAITYGIGFRLEPEGRSGFAHLFEHMMFEGTPKAPKGTLDRVIEAGGGSNNGFTRWDYTTYIEAAPVSALEPILWIEADRLTTLDFSKENLDNQRAVVQEEVRNNVMNQPYGGLEWLELPQKAFDRYPNSHNFYGDFKDLDAANIDDVRKFFEQYYAPNNAVLAIAGDVNPEEVFAKVEKYFGSIPSRAVPKHPDVTETPQTAERTETQPDKLAATPAIAIGYRMPARRSREAVVAAVVGELLHNGQASRLYQALVKDKKVATDVSGGLHWPIGNPFEFDGPALMATRIDHPGEIKAETVMTAYDAVIAQLAAKGPDRAELERMRAKMRSDWYRQLEAPQDRAIALAHATLFDGKPDRVNQIPGELATVTAAEVQAFVKQFLIKTNRTVIHRVPAAEKASAEGGN